jgi:hypothetical protein
MAKRRKAAATGLRRGPDRGQYMLVKWYPKKKRRGDVVTGKRPT